MSIKEFFAQPDPNAPQQCASGCPTCVANGVPTGPIDVVDTRREGYRRDRGAFEWATQIVLGIILFIVTVHLLFTSAWFVGIVVGVFGTLCLLLNEWCMRNENQAQVYAVSGALAALSVVTVAKNHHDAEKRREEKLRYPTPNFDTPEGKNPLNYR